MADPGEGPGGPGPPLFLDQNGSPPPVSPGVDAGPPPPPPPSLKIWIRHWYRPFPGTLSLFAGVGVGVFGRLRQPTQVAS